MHKSNVRHYNSSFQLHLSSLHKVKPRIVAGYYVRLIIVLPPKTSESNQKNSKQKQITFHIKHFSARQYTMNIPSKLALSARLALTYCVLSSLVMAGNINTQKQNENAAETAEKITMNGSVVRSGNLVSISPNQAFDTQTSSGHKIVLNFRYGLEAVKDDLDLDGDGITNEAICMDETGRPSFMCR